MSVIAGVFGQLATRAQQLVCGLGGHDALLHFEAGRMSLLCTSCGHQSPGWRMPGAPMGRRAEPIATGRLRTATRTSRVVQMPLTQERRVA